MADPETHPFKSLEDVTEHDLKTMTFPVAFLVRGTNIVFTIDPRDSRELVQNAELNKLLLGQLEGQAISVTTLSIAAYMIRQWVANQIRAESLKKDVPPILRFFAYEHLKPPLRDASKLFCDLAHELCRTAPDGPERAVALRKLLEAKDAAVRAAL